MGGDVIDVVVKKETLALIKKHLDPQAVEGVIHRLENGDLSDDEARSLVELIIEQRKDESSRLP